MSAAKKKSVFFFITVALGTGLLFVFSNQSSASKNSARKTELDPCQPKTAVESESDSLYGSEPNLFDGTGYSTGGGEFLYRAMGAVLLVLVLGITAIYISKKLLPKITNISGKEIRIIETIHLGPRKAVHLIEVCNQRFLIGSTNENIIKLADINSDLKKSSTQQTDDTQE